LLFTKHGVLALAPAGTLVPAGAYVSLQIQAFSTAFLAAKTLAAGNEMQNPAVLKRIKAEKY